MLERAIVTADLIIAVTAAALASWLTWLEFTKTACNLGTIALCLVIIPNCLFISLRRCLLKGH